MFSNKIFYSLSSILLIVFIAGAADSVCAQTGTKRVSGVKIAALDVPSPNAKKIKESSKNTSDDKNARAERENALRASKTQAQNERRREREKLALEKIALERQKLQVQTEARARLEREAQLKRDEDRRAKAEETDREREAKNKRAEIERLEREKAEVEKRAAAEREKLRKEQENALQLRDRQLAEAEKKAQETIRASRAQMLKEAETAAQVKIAAEREREKQAVLDELKKAEVLRLEAERKIRETAEKSAEQRETARRELISSIARNLRFLAPNEAFRIVPANLREASEIESYLTREIQKNPLLTRQINFCDRTFTGEDLRFETTSDTNLGSLLEALRENFDLNFIADAEIYDLPVRSNVGKLPWGSLLRAQLDFYDIMPRCEGNAVILMKREKFARMQETIAKTEPVRIEFIPLRYLQPTVSGTVDIAGKSAGNGSNAFNSLITQINTILKAGGDTRGSVAQIPNKPELIITATDKQIADIKEVIKRADKPSYQVVIYGLIYTANENKLRDIGGQLSVIGSANANNILGGVSNLGGTTSGSATSTGSTSTGSTAPGSLNPGGVRTFGNGFGTASATNPLIAASAILGTVQFSAQLALLQQKGVVRIENRPMILVENGQTGQLKIGRQVAVPIQQVGLGGVGNTGVTILNAANTLNVTPQVIVDLDGRPIGVKLDTQIESNEVDTTVVANGIPSIQQRSAQSNFQINLGDTVVVGDFTTDSDTDSETRTPGLGSLPGIGYLFKRKVKAMNRDRLFFALRVEVVPAETEINTVPLNLDTTPRIPENSFFAPYNQPQTEVTKTPRPAVPAKP